MPLPDSSTTSSGPGQNTLGTGEITMVVCLLVCIIEFQTRVELFKSIT
jgi:hypothetical protein